MFTREEWFQKNQWLADQYPATLRSLDVEADLSSSTNLADVTVYRTFEDGSSVSRDTYFVFEDGEWLHRFVKEEIDLFMPGISFEEFVEAQEGNSSGDTPSPAEEAAVESAVRAHYTAIGDNNFEQAFSYFGPTYRSSLDKEGWIDEEEVQEITDSTINSVTVSEISGTTATATVDVSFEDNTGTPRFEITWSLVKEGGEWKLDEQVSAEQVS